MWCYVVLVHYAVLHRSVTKYQTNTGQAIEGAMHNAHSPHSKTALAGCSVLACLIALLNRRGIDRSLVPGRELRFGLGLSVGEQ